MILNSMSHNGKKYRVPPITLVIDVDKDTKKVYDAGEEYEIRSLHNLDETFDPEEYWKLPFEKYRQFYDKYHYSYYGRKISETVSSIFTHYRKAQDEKNLKLALETMVKFYGKENMINSLESDLKIYAKQSNDNEKLYYTTAEFCLKVLKEQK